MAGLLVDRQGFPLEVGCFEGNRAETTTIVPIVRVFADRHQLAEMVVIADAGMLSGKNLAGLDAARLRFIVGSKVTKAPLDLASHFRWHGDAFTDGQAIDTITPHAAPRAGHASENDPPCVPSRSGTATDTPARGGQCGRTPPSAPPATGRP